MPESNERVQQVMDLLVARNEKIKEVAADHVDTTPLQVSVRRFLSADDLQIRQETPTDNAGPENTAE